MTEISCVCNTLRAMVFNTEYQSSASDTCTIRPIIVVDSIIRFAKNIFIFWLHMQSVELIWKRRAFLKFWTFNKTKVRKIFFFFFNVLIADCSNNSIKRIFWFYVCNIVFYKKVRPQFVAYNLVMYKWIRVFIFRAY